MKNFKKILSIILCMAMLISSALFVSATEAPSEINLGQNNGAVDLGNTTATWSWGWPYLYAGNCVTTQSITVSEDTEYFVKLRLAPRVGDAKFDIYVNDVKAIANITMPTTSESSMNVPVGLIELSSGDNVIKIVRQNSGGALAVPIYIVYLTEAVEDITSNPMSFALNAEDTVISGVAEKTGSDIKFDQTGTVTKTITTKKATQEYLLQVSAGTAFNGMIVDVTVNDVLVFNDYVIPNTGNADAKQILTLGKITLNQGVNTVKFARPGTSAGGQVGLGSITLVDDEFTLSEFVTNGETGVASVTAKANVIGDKEDSSATNAVIVVAMLDANGIILKWQEFQVQCAYGTVATVEGTVTTEGISGTVDKAQAFLWDCGAEASPSIFNTTMIELMPACESLND